MGSFFRGKGRVALIGILVVALLVGLAPSAFAANDFSGDENCVALWRFENNATDSIGGNDLTAVNTPTYDNANYQEGAYSIDLESSSSQICYIADGALDANFPGKGGTSEQSFSICAWVRLESDTTGYILNKGDTNTYSYGLYYDATDNKIYVYIGYAAGVGRSLHAFPTAISTGIWYHIGITYNATNNAVVIRIWDDNAGDFLDSNYSGTAAGDMSPDNAQMVVGWYAPNFWDGKIDELVFFNDVLTDDEIDAIRAGTYSLGGVPEVTTSAASSVEETTATLNGNITAVNDTTITERGFVWDTSTHGDPGNTTPGDSDYASNWTENGTFETGSYSHGVTSLTEGELYYARACAENDNGDWGYGDEVTFLTKPDEPTGLTGTPGDEHIDLSWSNGDGSQNTMIRFRTDGTYPTDYADGTQAYYGAAESYDHTSLTNGLTYYYRAWSYATEGALEQWSDTYSQYSGTPFVAPSVTTSAATSVEETTATLNGNITSLEGGGNCTIRGFEWDYDTGAPYTYDTHENGDFGTGAFALAVSSLNEGDLIYFRAYATNAEGTGYGDELTFLTNPDPPLTFTATAAGETQIDLAWTNGDGSQQVYIRGNLGSPPSDRDDGAYSWNGAGVSTSHSGLSSGQHWYYIIWSYATEGALEQTSDPPDLSDDATTLTPPSVTTNVCTGFDGTSATVSGTVTDIGTSNVTSVGFDYGVTDVYGGSETITVNWSSENNFTITITGLTPATPYHFRAKAYNGAWGYGSDATFSTTGSPTLFEDYTAGGDTDSNDIYGANWTAMQFTSESTAHTVTYINLILKRVGSPGTITIGLYHATDGLPTGLVIVDTTFNGNNLGTGYQLFSFEVDETSLSASSQYAIVVSAPSGGAADYVLWQGDAGGGIANAVGSHSANGGVSWTSDTPVDYLFEIWGYGGFEVVGANVFSGYLEDGDTLIAVEYENIYSPYANVTDPTAYFQVQLLTTDGNTVLAAVSMPAWGYKVASIYLNADASVSLTPGAAYYVRIYGVFSGNPSTQYQLQSTDWRSSLTDLDTWVINAAYNIQDYYGLSGDDVLVQVVVGMGQQLTASGGGYFCSIGGAGGYYNSPGIPYLVNVRPHLFSVTDIYVEWDTGEPDLVYDTAEEMEAQLGSDIYDDMSFMGSMIGTTPQQFGQILVYLVIGSMLFILLGSGGTVFGGIFVASFLLMIGNHFRVISIQTTLVFAIAMILLFVVNFWWQNR